MARKLSIFSNSNLNHWIFATTKKLGRLQFLGNQFIIWAACRLGYLCSSAQATTPVGFSEQLLSVGSGLAPDHVRVWIKKAAGSWKQGVILTASGLVKLTSCHFASNPCFDLFCDQHLLISCFCDQSLLVLILIQHQLIPPVRVTS